MQEVIALTSCLAASVCAEPFIDKTIRETPSENPVLTSCFEVTQFSDHNQDKEEKTMEMQEHTRFSSTAPMDQCVSVPVAAKDDDAEGCTSFCHTGQLKEEHGGNKTQRNKCSQQESEPMCKADDGDFSIEPAVGVQSKRRRRMGMCGLTEKERSHFLQTQMREHGKVQREAEEKRVEDGGCTGDSSVALDEYMKPCSRDDEPNVVVEEGNLASVLNSPSAQSIPLGSFTNQSGVEREPLPPICEAVDRLGCVVDICF